MSELQFVEVLRQDDCSPDSKEFFEKEMRERFGLLIKDFGPDTSPDDCVITKYAQNMRYRLEMCAEDPFWILYEKKYVCVKK